MTGTVPFMVVIQVLRIGLTSSKNLVNVEGRKELAQQNGVKLYLDSCGLVKAGKAVWCLPARRSFGNCLSWSASWCLNFLVCDVVQITSSLCVLASSTGKCLPHRDFVRNKPNIAHEVFKDYWTEQLLIGYY